MTYSHRLEHLTPTLENVQQAERTADEGRDILMDEVVDGPRWDTT